MRPRTIASRQVEVSQQDRVILTDLAHMSEIPLLFEEHRDYHSFPPINPLTQFVNSERILLNKRESLKNRIQTNPIHERD
jgi:hypothetical protein